MTTQPETLENPLDSHAPSGTPRTAELIDPPKAGDFRIRTHLHDGHRYRLRQRIKRYGPGSLSEHERLEALLYYALPRINTNDLAHRLIEEFGTVEDVFNAPEERLLEFKGLGENTAVYFQLLAHLIEESRHVPYSARNRRAFNNFSDVSALVLDSIGNSSTEKLQLLLFDASMRLLKSEIIAEGNAISVPVVTSEIAKKALNANAAMVIIAHNHPDCDVFPSRADVEISSRVDAALSIFKIKLVEHVICTSDRCYPSLRLHQSPSAAISSLGEGFYARFYNS